MIALVLKLLINPWNPSIKQIVMIGGQIWRLNVMICLKSALQGASSMIDF
jgi:hypothetical protein